MMVILQTIGIKEIGNFCRLTRDIMNFIYYSLFFF